jgi:geranylgeranyl pyrophosphate synthase
MVDIEKHLKEMAPLIDRTIEKYIPRSYDENSMIFASGKPRHEYHIEAINKAIAEPIWEFLDRGGKRWRPVLTLLVCEALGGDSKKFLDFVVIPEVVHNGTLMIDDIEDSSEFRRGKPCTYKIFGVDIAINAGNAMYYLPLLTLIKNNTKISAETMNKIYNIYAQEMINLSFGQAMDIAWHRGLANADEISEKNYLQMCAFKTGTLARMAAKIGAVLAGANEKTTEKMGKFAESLGVAFQIQDDILNLTGEEFAERKGGLGEDITEGKRSLMVIHTLKKASTQDKKRLLEILNMHTQDQNLRNEAIKIIENYGSLKYAKEFARKMVEESWYEIDRLLPESDAKEKLKAFSYYMFERKI